MKRLLGLLVLGTFNVVACGGDEFTQDPGGAAGGTFGLSVSRG